MFTISKLDSDRDVLRRAEAVWKAAAYDGGTLIDLSGNGHHATVNGAIQLPYRGKPYLYYPTTNPNGAYATDADQKYFQGNEIDVRVRLSRTSWPTGGTYHTVISKYNTGTNQRTFEIRTGDTGFNVYVSRNGSSTTALNASSAGLPTNTPIWLRATYSASSGNLALYWSRDAQGWTTLGTASGATGTLFKTNISVGVGIRPTGFTQGCPGSGFYRATVIEDGVATLDFNPSDSREPHSGWTSALTGESWVINRPTSNYRAALVDRPLLLLDGIDDHLVVTHHSMLDATTAGFTVVAAVRLAANNISGELVSKKQGSSASYAGYRSLLTSGYPRGQVSDGTTNYTNGSVGDVRFPALVSTLAAVLITPIQVKAYTNGEYSTSLTHALSNALTNSRDLYIGSLNGTESFLPCEFIGAAVFREALSQDQLRRVAQQFGVKL